MNSQMYKDTHLDNLETIGLVPMGLPFLDYYINWITQHVVFWLADFYLGQESVAWSFMAQGLVSSTW